ncbi:MAG: ribosome biogenesis GTP-binding protein YihA/YsxC [Salinivirgaceae bacterium]|jgi:GTP-binding protein|nr:ribosome biogenesis GTP-binding protein YihA/YsxC [Salinivirgaceae bacterium]
MEIKKAAFITSNQDYRNCPDHQLTEFAFIGRSNVGKSSLINMLTNQKRLAKISGKPGKTLLINHFLMNDNWYLVDLPGYGFARIPKAMQRKLQQMIEAYILKRENLTQLFILIDGRHEPMKVDIDFINWVGGQGVPFALIFTKSDKSKRRELNKILQLYEERLKESWDELPKIFVTSATNGEGKAEVLKHIQQIIEQV